MKLLRILIFSAGCILLLQPSNLGGFQYQGCYASINTVQESECATCCTSLAVENVATDGTGVGSMGFGYMNFSCGTQIPGACPPNSNYCTSGSYVAAVDNPSCCSGFGGPCGYDGDCCGNLVCGSGGLCLTCIGNGGTCSGNSDCCSGYCVDRKSVV